MSLDPRQGGTTIKVSNKEAMKRDNEYKNSLERHSIHDFCFPFSRSTVLSHLFLSWLCFQARGFLGLFVCSHDVKQYFMMYTHLRFTSEVLVKTADKLSEKATSFKKEIDV